MIESLRSDNEDADKDDNGHSAMPIGYRVYEPQHRNTTEMINKVDIIFAGVGQCRNKHFNLTGSSNKERNVSTFCMVKLSLV